jgi:hypothetical protein
MEINSSSQLDIYSLSGAWWAHFEGFLHLIFTLLLLLG